MTQKTDPSEWDRYAAHRLVLAHDYGFKSDHSTLLVGGLWKDRGVNFTGIIHIEQISLNTPPLTVRQHLFDCWQTFKTTTGTLGVVVDSRSNQSHFQDCCLMGIAPTPLGLNLTGAERHAAKPQPILIPSGNERPVVAYEFNMSRTQMFDDVNAALENKTLYLTKTGDYQKLVDEMVVLERHQTAARNTIYQPPIGGHDDLAVSLGYVVYVLTHLTAMMRPVQRRGTVTPAINSAAWT